MKRFLLLLSIFILLFCAACTDYEDKYKIKKPASISDAQNSSSKSLSETEIELRRFKILDSDSNVILTEWDIDEATYGYSPESYSYYVMLKFNEAGSKIFSYATKTNIGNKLSIYLDNQLVSSPLVNEEITDGECIITGFDSEDMVIEMWNKISDAMLGIGVG